MRQRQHYGLVLRGAISMAELILRHFIDKDGKVAYIFPPYDDEIVVAKKEVVLPVVKEIEHKKTLKGLFKK
jgi:hypothetical protein